MSEQHIHIVSFDIPVPANYGGAIDVFYKIKMLSSLGVRIHLHCFEYNREHSEELNKLCENVYYYKRLNSPFFLLHKLPYIVATRQSEKLIEILASDDYPVLFEGLHSCFYVNHPSIAHKQRIVRTHNIEHDYYRNLANVESNFFKRLYFNLEANKLERFERVLSDVNAIAAISKNDTMYFNNKYGHTTNVSAFHSHETVAIREGRGDYALYHGSLAVGENNEAALYLVNNVFSKIDFPLIIAGNKPSVELQRLVSKHSNVEIRSDVNTEGIYELIANAQVNILPTFQATGIKLKLLAALFSGRHCVVNTPMVVDTGLETLCSICDTPEAMISKLKELWSKDFSQSDILNRKDILEKDFSNDVNGLKLKGLIESL